MPIDKVFLFTEYKITCDHCGETGPSLPSAKQAMELASAMGWKIIEWKIMDKSMNPYEFVCPKCQRDAKVKPENPSRRPSVPTPAGQETL